MEQNILESTSSKGELLLFNKLQNISAINFHDIKFSGNVYLLDKDYSEDKIYSTSDVIEINKTWLSLYDDYFEKTNDTRFKKDLKNKKRSLDLLIEINIIESVLKVLESIEENEKYVPIESHVPTIISLGNSLKKLNKKIKFDSLLPLKTNISRVKAYVGGLKSRYEINFKEDLVVEDVDITFYYETIIQIARVLKIDYIPDHINMLQYIAYEKAYKRELKNAEQYKRKQASKRTN